MDFLKMWPFAFLLFIPIIIILYLLKQRSIDFKVPSLYLWREAYKNNTATTPFQKFRNNLLMYLQIITIIVLIFALASPIIKNFTDVRKNAILVIDSSASMQREYKEGTTRFNSAIDSAKKYIKNMSTNSNVSIIEISDTAKVRISNSNDKKKALRELDKIKVTDMAGNMELAMNIVHAVLKGDENTEVIIFTDNATSVSQKDYTIVDMNSANKNAYISLVSSSKGEKGYNVLVTVNNESQEEINTDINLYGDNKLLDISNVTVEGKQNKSIIFKDIEFDGKILTAEINNKDSLQKDNSRKVALGEEKSPKVLLLTKKNVFLEKVLQALGEFDVYKMDSVDDYPDEEFDLYIFDGFEPQTLPEKGNLLFFNSNYYKWFKGKTNSKGGIITIGNTEYTNHLANYTFGVNEFLEYDVPEWAEVFMKSNNKSIAFAGTYDSRKVGAVGFDLHSSQFPLEVEFPVFMIQLITNLVTSDFVANNTVTTGEEVKINGRLDGEKIKIIDIQTNKLLSEYNAGTILSEQNHSVGEFYVSQKYKSGELKGNYVVNFPVSESVNASEMKKSNNQISVNEINGDYNLKNYVIAICILLIILEWAVYLRKS